jgi:hypothetical protein
MILLCLAAAVPLTGRTQSADEGSVPEPTRMAVMASRLDARVATVGELQRIDSNDAVAEIAGIEISAGDKREQGVRIDLRNESGADSLYLDAQQGRRLRDDLTQLERNSELACESGIHCAGGIARCRPSQSVAQAFCPTAYRTREGKWGISISTPGSYFAFPGVKAADFSSVLTIVIQGLDGADKVVSR